MPLFEMLQSSPRCYDMLPFSLRRKRLQKRHLVHDKSRFGWVMPSNHGKYINIIYTLTTNRLAGGLKYFMFSPLLEEMIQFEEDFSIGLKPPTNRDLNKGGHEALTTS